ncbi:MAG: DUF1211 domain-containing protein [Hyphomonadaceae bacterium]|nr:DUF1211 domain-containing protein [Hyphomonadaceae bacterium]
MGPVAAAYLISFLNIYILWVAHHQLMRIATRADASPVSMTAVAKTSSQAGAANFGSPGASIQSDCFASESRHSQCVGEWRISARSRHCCGR